MFYVKKFCVISCFFCCKFTFLFFILLFERLFEQCKDLSDAPDEKAFMSALNKVDDGNSTTDEIMGMILQTALSKDIMFPAIKDMREKYAIYLVENRAKIDVETFERFEKQQKVYLKLVTFHLFFNLEIKCIK